MAMGGMTRAQGRRSAKLKNKRAARRASGIVQIHKDKHKKQQLAKRDKKRSLFAAGARTPRGTTRALRRGNSCYILGTATVS